MSMKLTKKIALTENVNAQRKTNKPQRNSEKSLEMWIKTNCLKRAEIW